MEKQSAEIQNQVNQLRAELKLANDTANARCETLDEQVIALKTKANSYSNLMSSLEWDMAKEGTCHSECT